MNICVVCEYGWIIVGVKSNQTNKTDLILSNASVVRCWRSGKGIGGIAKDKKDYTLDIIGDVIIKQEKVLFEIPCEW